jgi:16S rRNA (guanine527-N7)-methyltransferase
VETETLELRRLAARMGVQLSPAAAEGLLGYEELLAARAVPSGAIAAEDLARLRERHILDCLRAAALARPSDRDAVDIGSGAGLPGIVVAIARRELVVTVVDARRSRVAFLEMVAERLSLGNVRVRHARVEQLGERAGLCFARAVASLEKSWSLAMPILRRRGRMIYFAGKGTTMPERPAGAASIEIVAPPDVATAGPLVIIGRP